jgi:DNA-directed RNA polymerase alpha subunit
LLFVSKIKHDQLTILDNHQIVKLEDKEICMKILEKSYSKEKAKTSFILTTPIVRLSTEFGLDFSMTLLNFFRTINVETFEDLIKYSENDLENFKILNNRKMGELKNMLIDLDLKLAE